MTVVSTKHKHEGIGTSVKFGIPTVGSNDSDKTGLDNKNWSGSKLSPSPVLTCSYDETYQHFTRKDLTDSVLLVP